MCTSCGEDYRIFSVEIVTKEPVNTNMELYKEIATRLFQNKVISNINVGNNKAYNVGGRQLFGFELHLGNEKKPSTVTIDNVKTALNGILDQFEGYSEMQIKLN